MSLSNNQTFSKLGFILTAAGSAVGLGNIWRFPYLTANNGGGTFILVYIVCSIFIGLSLLIAEFVIGKYLGHPFLEKLTHLKHHKVISKVIYLNPVLAFLIMSFYFVVAGWTLFYLVNSATTFIHYKTSSSHMYYESIFNNLLANPIQLFIYAFIFLLITSFINYKGIIEGVEKLNLFLLPLLFVLLVVMVLKILSLNNAFDGVKYLFEFHKESFNLKMLVNALGQAFFSLSVGLGNMIVFASFVPKNYNLKTSALSITIIGTLVGIFAALLIIPAVFSFGYSLNTGGPGLAFITLPMVFAHMNFGIVLAILFFLVMVFAAVTSTISLVEVTIPYLIKLFNISRNQAIILNGIIVTILLFIQCLSFNIFSGIKIFNNNIFDFSNLLTSILFIFGATLIAFMIGWGMSKKDVRKELTNNESIAFPFFKTWLFTVKYIVPIIVTIMIIMIII
ncbi:sodium:neurotransmitter symporter [Candidatus Hepatincola sp. Pdp]